LRSTESNSRWRDLLNGEELTAKGEWLARGIVSAKLRVLIQENTFALGRLRKGTKLLNDGSYAGHWLGDVTAEAGFV
jgi:hypothetical protein